MPQSLKRFHVGDRLSEMAAFHCTVYLAGQVADDATAAIEGQTAQVLASIDRLLAEAGTDSAHILMAQIYLADMADFEAMNRVWEDWLPPGDAPPRATVQARLARPEWKVEIVVTAAISRQRLMRALRRAAQLAALAGVALVGQYALSSWDDHAAARLMVERAGPGDIVMVSSRTCAYCAAARSWLGRHQVPFTECFIETMPACADTYRALQAPGTPVMLVRGHAQTGFDAQRVARGLQ